MHTSAAHRILLTLVISTVVGGVALTGCKAEKPASVKGSGGELPTSFLLDAKPADAKPLLAVKAAAKKGDRVVFEARVGGRAEPFVKGRAVMVVIDPSLPSCADNPGDGCPKPWDYCCETQETLVASTATVRFVDASGKPLTVGLDGQHGLEALRWITVVGEVADRDDAGLFVVNASGVHLGKKS